MLRSGGRGRAVKLGIRDAAKVGAPAGRLVETYFAVKAAEVDILAIVGMWGIVTSFTGM